MLARRHFWEQFARPWLLLFEIDAVLCPMPTYPLSTFLDANYPYYGAPWNRTRAQCRWRYTSNGVAPRGCVGNSGLSLWNRSLVAALATVAGSEFSRGEWEAKLEGGNASGQGSGGEAVRGGDGRAVVERAPALSQSLAHLPKALRKRLAHDLYFGGVADGCIDQWYSGLLYRHMPPDDLAARFSVETLWAAYGGDYTPYGSHNPIPYLNATQLETLARRCPPLRHVIREKAPQAPLWNTMDGHRIAPDGRKAMRLPSRNMSARAAGSRVQ